MGSFIYSLGNLVFGIGALYCIFAVNSLFWKWYCPIRADRKGHSGYLRTNFKFQSINGSKKRYQYSNGDYGDFYYWEETVSKHEK